MARRASAAWRAGRRLDRFLLLAHDGSVYALPDPETALEALADPVNVAGARLAKRLTPA